MGLHLKKKLRKDPESDEEFENADSVESDDATVEEDEEVEEEGEDDDDIDEEGEEEDVDEEVDDDDRDEEEDDYNDSLGEEEEEGEETDSENKKNKIYRDAEMNELEKEYMNLRHQEQDILQNLKRHKDEDVLKGQAVKNQKALWDKTLELRFLLQKAFSTSNRLPQSAVRSTFCNSDKGVDTAYSELICSSKKTLDSLLELQEALIEKNPSILQDSDGKSGKSSKHSEYVDDDDDWARIYQLHARIAPFRDKSIDKWQRKTQVTTGTAAIKSKLHAFNQNVSQQVAGYMRDPSRMIKQMQLRRLTVGIFGTESQTDSGAQADGKSQIDNGAQVDGDPELIDDSEFYQQLLKEFFENIDPSSSETAFYALKRLQTKKRKIVDRRASKSRKIRYHVHEKIVNFMAPQPMDLPPMAPKLFENLFGLRTQKAALE